MVIVAGLNKGVFYEYIHTHIHTYFIVTSPMGLFRSNYLNY